jgi:neutral trehalase
MNRPAAAALIAMLAWFAPAARAVEPSELSTFLKKSGAKTGIVKPAKGILKHPYLVPAGPYFQLFDWDMYFMGAALSYDRVSEPVADSVRDFLDFVDENANNSGYAPREIATDQPWALPEQCKPFMAQAAVRAALTSGKWDWIKPLYPKLRSMVRFWEDTRRAPDGLFVWYNGVESGTDNSPAVIDVPALTTEGVDLQVYLYREYLALARIARELGDAAAAAENAKKAADLKDLALKKMWSEQDGLFYNIDARTGRPIKVKAWTSFTPLWAKMASPEQAKRMIEGHLLSKAEFWSPHGVRTLALDEAAYRPQDGYWRGPIWVISNYLVMRGLLNYGYRTEAIELAGKTVDLLVADFRKSGGMNECYNPETGATTAGGHFVSWNLLSEHMLDEARTGADPTALERPGN